MDNHERRSSSSPEAHVIINTNLEISLHRLLPCFGLFSLIMSSGARIYRAYSNDDIPTVSFVTFLCYTALLFYYCFELNQQIPPWERSPKKHKIQIGIWILLSALMFGYCLKFSKLTRASPSFSFLGVVISGNMLILEHYSFWEGNNSLRTSPNSVTKSRFKSVRVNERASEMKTRDLASVL